MRELTTVLRNAGGDRDTLRTHIQKASDRLCRRLQGSEKNSLEGPAAPALLLVDKAEDLWKQGLHQTLLNAKCTLRAMNEM
jgi:hypothetical protein